MTANERLKQQQELLRAEIKRREAAMQMLTDQLEENFGRVIMNSVLPVNKKRLHSINHTFDTMNGFLNSFLGGTKTPGKYEGLFNSFRTIAAGLAWKYIRKMLSR